MLFWCYLSLALPWPTTLINRNRIQLCWGANSFPLSWGIRWSLDHSSFTELFVYLSIKCSPIPSIDASFACSAHLVFCRFLSHLRPIHTKIIACDFWLISLQILFLCWKAWPATLDTSQSPHPLEVILQLSQALNNHRPSGLATKLAFTEMPQTATA